MELLRRRHRRAAPQLHCARLQVQVYCGYGTSRKAGTFTLSTRLISCNCPECNGKAMTMAQFERHGGRGKNRNAKLSIRTVNPGKGRLLADGRRPCVHPARSSSSRRCAAVQVVGQQPGKRAAGGAGAATRVTPVLALPGPAMLPAP